MNLTDVLTADRIRSRLAGATKQAILEELVDVLVASGAVTDRQGLLSAVLERERTRTTGIGGGLAIPHGMGPSVQTLAIALGRPTTPVDFESVDGKPVSLVILLAAPPDQIALHIQALAHISRLMSLDALRRKIDDAPNAERIFKAIRDAEQAE